MNEISTSLLFAKDDIYPDKYTIAKMPWYEQWQYIENGIKSGSVARYVTNQRSMWGSAAIVVYYDKTLDVYTECHPWTGSFWKDITQKEFQSYGLTVPQ